MRIAMAIQRPGQGFMEMEKAIEHNIGRGFSHVGDFREAGFLHVLDKHELAQSFDFDRLEFVFAVENGLQGFLFVEERPGDVGVIAVLADPRHLRSEIGMLAEKVIDFRREVMAMDRLGAPMTEQPGDVEKRLVLGRDGELAVKDEFPEAACVAKRELRCRLKVEGCRLNVAGCKLRTAAV